MEQKTILILSPDPRMVDAVKDALPDDGYRVVYDESFNSELQESLKSIRPDIVLVDVGMPSMDGVELCLRVRQMSPAPILMLSAWKAKRNRVRKFDAFKENCLSKPITCSELMQRINQALS